eukprot:TRINITY_DN4498_c0_g1_i3.p1 TRINITY_DN4498_c0_g1~~TRINITY_DN4498_c0_g1_i3.p1  ORF type:complete len:312 (+),score=61.30 TRINITY_DN4498_c0_g1_i3:67-1002(+)
MAEWLIGFQRPKFKQEDIIFAFDSSDNRWRRAVVVEIIQDFSKEINVSYELNWDEPVKLKSFNKSANEVAELLVKQGSSMQGATLLFQHPDTNEVTVYLVREGKVATVTKKPDLFEFSPAFGDLSIRLEAPRVVANKRGSLRDRPPEPRRKSISEKLIGERFSLGREYFAFIDEDDPESKEGSQSRLVKFENHGHWEKVLLNEIVIHRNESSYRYSFYDATGTEHKGVAPHDSARFTQAIYRHNNTWRRARILEYNEVTESYTVEISDNGSTFPITLEQPNKQTFLVVDWYLEMLRDKNRTRTSFSSCVIS